jgi:hypothetical protein
MSLHEIEEGEKAVTRINRNNQWSMLGAIAVNPAM